MSPVQLFLKERDWPDRQNGEKSVDEDLHLTFLDEDNNLVHENALNIRKRVGIGKELASKKGMTSGAPHRVSPSPKLKITVHPLHWNLKLSFLIAFNGWREKFEKMYRKFDIIVRHDGVFATRTGN